MRPDVREFLQACCTMTFTIRSLMHANLSRCVSVIANASLILHLPQVQELPQVLPEIFADAAARAREAGFRRRRIALCARVHDGRFSERA